MNHITIVGKLGSDPEVRFTNSQMAVAEFRVASTTGKDDKKKTTWFSVKMFGKLAEHIADTLFKGDNIIIFGRQETDEYTKKDGSKGSFTYVIAEDAGPSARWDKWVKDKSGETMARVGKVFNNMPATEEEPF